MRSLLRQETPTRAQADASVVVAGASVDSGNPILVGSSSSSSLTVSDAVLVVIHWRAIWSSNALVS